jgi:hypothetical protein
MMAEEISKLSPNGKEIITVVEIPEASKASLRNLLTQRKQADVNIQLYIRALQDTLEITGEGWSLDLAEMIFNKQSPNGKVEADVVGTVASNNAGK